MFEFKYVLKFNDNFIQFMRGKRLEFLILYGICKCKSCNFSKFISKLRVFSEEILKQKRLESLILYGIYKCRNWNFSKLIPKLRVFSEKILKQKRLESLILYGIYKCRNWNFSKLIPKLRVFSEKILNLDNLLVAANLNRCNSYAAANSLIRGVKTLPNAALSIDHAIQE